MTPKIERGVPIPDKHRPVRSKNYLQRIMKQMRPGDSIYFEVLDTRNLYQAGRTAFGSGNFTSRKEKAGARIWRLR